MDFYKIIDVLDSCTTIDQLRNYEATITHNADLTAIQKEWLFGMVLLKNRQLSKDHPAPKPALGQAPDQAPMNNPENDVPPCGVN